MAVLFYFEKAYDTMWQHGIMEDLHVIGLCGHLPIFINCLSTSRHFCVHVKTTYSNLHSQELGVPQGSILAMTLFCVKVKGIPAAVKREVSCRLFVDDFVLFYLTTGESNWPCIESCIQFPFQNT